MRIVIQSIPHRDQRYGTAGDYFETRGAEETVLEVKVSELPRNEMLLVAIHELIEWSLCQAKGITNEEIDKFDMEYENDYPGHDGVGAIEPGDNSSAPYYRQHQIASGVERILAAEMGVDWQSYETHIQELKR